MRTKITNTYLERRDDVLTSEEARKLLRCSRGVFYRGIKDGTIPSIRLGPRKIVVPKAALIRMLQEGTHLNK
jgi:excisionase family DNA binding protein